MARRHLSARCWLFTDERIGEALWPALERLPAGAAGVIVRHYRSPDRRALFERVRAVARRRRLVLVLAGSPALAAAWRADGWHGRDGPQRTTRPLIWTAPCHDLRELVQARDATLRFVSPVFATRSHPGARALGLSRAGLLVAGDRHRLAALGGVTRARARGLRELGFEAWGAIDAWT